jgi:hypothetical protein
MVLKDNLKYIIDKVYPDKKPFKIRIPKKKTLKAQRMADSTTDSPRD